MRTRSDLEAVGSIVHQTAVTVKREVVVLLYDHSPHRPAIIETFQYAGENRLRSSPRADPSADGRKR